MLQLSSQAERQSRDPIRDLGFVTIWTLFIRRPLYFKMMLSLLSENQTAMRVELFKQEEQREKEQMIIKFRQPHNP